MATELVEQAPDENSRTNPLAPPPTLEGASRDVTGQLLDLAFLLDPSL